MSEFVSIAYIVRTRGIRGEVAAELLTDFPQRFENVREVRVESPEGAYQEVLDSHWFHKGRVILKFAGRDTPEAALPLVRGEVLIPRSQRVPLPEDSYYDSDLVGCRVINGAELLGEVTEVARIGHGVSNLVVAGPKGREWMLPLAREFVVEVDLKEKRIEARPLPGLLELSTPTGNWKGKRKLRREKRGDGEGKARRRRRRKGS